MKLVHTTLALSLVAAAAAFCQPSMAQATIDQSKATTKGIGGGDTAGFPITITQPGSYKLMSNLVVPSGSYGIEVSVPGATIDLNGFTMAGGYVCTGAWSAMTCTGSGRGITGGAGVAVRNGFIKDFEYGVGLGERAVIEDVAVEGTSYGLFVGLNSQVGVLWDSTNRAEADLLASLQAAASALGMTVLDGDARDATAIPVALTSLVRAGANGLYVSPSSVNASQTRLVVDFALAHRLPSIFGDKRFVSEGGLMSYWIDWRDLRRRSAVYVDKILKGAKPADLPVEQPTKLEMVINLKTAKALGLTIPQSLLLRADEVIQ